MFKFEEIKETLEKYPYNKLMADYEIRKKVIMLKVMKWLMKLVLF